MVSLNEFEAYLRASGASANTIRVRIGAVRCLCSYREISYPTEINRIDVISFLGRPASPWTRLTYWSSLTAWANFVREFWNPDYDPMKGIARPRTPEPVARPIADAAVTRLLASDMRNQTRAYVLLALYQALRVHEIAKIRAEDFDFESGWLTVVGKGNIAKVIPIHQKVMDIAPYMPSRGYWFPGRDGESHVKPNTVTIRLSVTLNRAGIAATGHQLRDTCATRMQRQQKDIRVTQAMLRHKQMSSTQKYVAVSDTDLEAAVRSLTWSPDGGGGHSVESVV